MATDIPTNQSLAADEWADTKQKSIAAKMEKKDEPLRPVHFAIKIVIAFACIVGLYLQDPNEVLDWLTMAGICVGIVLLVFIAGTIRAVINERSNRNYEAQSPERLKQHQARFYCHICGKPSPQPHQYWDQYGEHGQLYSSFLVTDYNQPTELVQCAQCQKWTCPNADSPHMENGVCKKCLEDAPEQV